MDATTELAKLQQERGRASARVSDLEAQWRQAAEASRTASAELAEVERQGSSATTRHRAEEALAPAKQRAAEPWAERVEGAKAAVRDLDARRRAFITENLGELVGQLEVAGEAAADRFNAVAADLLAAYAEVEQVAARIGQTIVVVARPGQVDVSRPRGEEAFRAVAALLAAGGGEQGPTLDRTRPPWNHLLGLEDDSVEVEDAAAGLSRTASLPSKPASN